MRIELWMIFMRSLIAYGIEILIFMSKTTKKRFKTIYMKTLRKAAGLPTTVNKHKCLLYTG